MGPIQSAVNAGVSAGAKAAVAKKGFEEAKAAEAGKQAAAAQKAAQEAENAKKAAEAQNLRALGAIEDYQTTAKKEENAAKLTAESAGEQSAIASKIEEQRQKMRQEGLTPRQVAGHKGSITRMREAMARVDEERKAREYQQKLLEKRKEVLRSIHGEAWERMGVNPEGGQKDGE